MTGQAAQASDHSAATLAPTLERTRLLADDLGREDLAQRLRDTRRRVTEPGVRVLVVGEFKQGKSTLINEVVGRAVCPVDDDIATAVLTHLRYSPETWGKAFRQPEADRQAEAEPIDPAGAAMYVSELGNPANEKELLRVEFGLPSNALKQGMILIDTPGVGGLESAHGYITISALAQADAVVFVTDASQELSGPELGFLKHAHELCPTVIHTVTKIDVYPEWRRVMELSQAHIRNAGLEGSVLGVSCTIHSHARKVRDSALAEESGFPALLELLRNDVIEPGERVVALAALRVEQSSLDQLLAPLVSERDVLENPDRGEQLLAEYGEAQRLSEQLQTEAARWQVTLNDGIGDLNATVDHDLRAATRSIIAEGEAAIDAGDPADFWQEFQADVYAKMSAGIIENFSLLTNEVSSLVQTVESHFAVAEEALSESFDFAAPVTQLRSLEIDDSNVKLDREGIVSKGFSGLKGGYTGVLMLTFGGGLIGLGAIVLAPVGIMAGVLMGKKVLKTERERVLLTSRQQAKQALRKYVDEVLFQVGKESRDALRDVQKELRDLFTARATELSRSTKEAVTRTQQALNADTSSKQSRLQELNTTIEQIEDLQRTCDGILAGVSQ